MKKRNAARVERRHPRPRRSELVGNGGWNQNRSEESWQYFEQVKVAEAAEWRSIAYHHRHGSGSQFPQRCLVVFHILERRAINGNAASAKLRLELGARKTGQSRAGEQVEPFGVKKPAREFNQRFTLVETRLPKNIVGNGDRHSCIIARDHASIQAPRVTTPGQAISPTSFGGSHPAAIESRGLRRPRLRPFGAAPLRWTANCFRLNLRFAAGELSGALAAA